MTAITMFKDLLAKGHKGEALVANLFQALGYEVQDVSKEASYFSKDIDLIATKGDEQLLLEVMILISMFLYLYYHPLIQIIPLLNSMWIAQLVP